jgi:AraC-like DNA-binding protein
MRIEGRGRICIWEGASLWVLEAEHGIGGTDHHAHHAIQVTLALDGNFTLRAADERLAGPAVAVASDARHIFEATGLAAFLFVAPESRAGRALAATLFQGKALASLDRPGLGTHLDALAACFRNNGDDAVLADAAQALLADLAGPAEAPASDARVQAMLAWLDGNLETALTLPQAAAAACLSPSRARHLFAAETGLPFKAFVLWRRMERAVALFAAGASLTEAAHEAGFADSAHFSRTFRRHFGLPAAALRVNAALDSRRA